MIGKTNASIGGSASGGTTNPSNGVYIYADDGKYYTTDEWMTKYKAILVAVITDNCQFGIALENAKIGSSSSFSFCYSVGTVYSDQATAITDYDGLGNTSKISYKASNYNTSNLYGNSQNSPCGADAARNYEFADGRLGYLGSLGEWKAVIDNISAVEEALSYAGGAALSTSAYITSTKKEDGRGSIGYEDTDWAVKGTKITTGGSVVRAFCRLNKDEGFKTKTFMAATQEYTSYFEFEPGMTWYQWAKSNYAPSGSRYISSYYYPIGSCISISGSSFEEFPQIVPGDRDMIGGRVHLLAVSEEDLA